MNKNEAIKIFQKILHYYQAIKTPKYQHVDYEDLLGKHKSLDNIKEHLQGNKIYHDLTNGISQILAKLEKQRALDSLSREQIWSNYSERGMNKTIRTYPKKKHNTDKFPILWLNQGEYECALTNGYWGHKNFIVMDLLGYTLLMLLGGDRLPENLEPIFENLESIKRREEQLNDNIQKINRTTYSICIDDNYFREKTGLKMSSNEIFQLLQETSRAEFKLPFPAIVKDSNGKETTHNMNWFSRFFELGEQEIKIRKDGIVQLREYRIHFSTLLGELFVNNLTSKHNDRVDLRFYNLPETAQLFYRRFLLHISFTTKPLNLKTITDGLGLRDKNKSNLIKTIKASILKPLINDNLISSYEFSEGLKGTKLKIFRNDQCRRM